MQELGIGLIGASFMGKTHTLAFGSVKAVMRDVPNLRLEILSCTPLKVQKNGRSIWIFTCYE